MVEEKESRIQGWIGGVKKLAPPSAGGTVGRTSLVVIHPVQLVGGALPIDLVRKLKWKERQRVVVKKVRGGVLIKDWKR